MRPDSSFVLACMVVAISIVTACGGGPAPAPSGAAAPPADSIAPDFQVEDLDGRPVSLSDTAGSVRIVDFWATWCPPCVEEMPMFKELHETYADRGLVILGLSSDDDVDDVRAFVDEHDLPWTNALAPEEVREQYQVLGLPQTMLIDADGRIAKRFNPGVVPKAVLVEWIEKLLGETPARDA